MLVNYYSIISYRENERERKEEVDDKVKSEEIKDNENISDKETNIENKNDDKKGIRNVIYIDVKGSVCGETPARITNNRTPPPCFSPHITTIQNHLILLHFKFCLANVHSCQYEQGTRQFVLFNFFLL